MTTDLLYVVEENYDEVTDSYSLLLYDAKWESYHEDTVSGLEFEINEDGYVCASSSDISKNKDKPARAWFKPLEECA